MRLNGVLQLPHVTATQMGSPPAQEQDSFLRAIGLKRADQGPI